MLNLPLADLRIHTVYKRLEVYLIIPYLTYLKDLTVLNLPLADLRSHTIYKRSRTYYLLPYLTDLGDLTVLNLPLEDLRILGKVGKRSCQ